MKNPSFSRISVFGCLFVTMIAANALKAAEIESSIARGGLLYDKWYAVVGAEVAPDDGVP